MGRTYAWPGMKAEVERWVRECRACQMVKVTRHVKEPLHEVSPHDGSPGATVHIDLVGPFTPQKGFRYLCTMVDRETGYPVVVPIADPTSADSLKAFRHGWVQHFGYPDHLISDNGKNFVSGDFKGFLALNGIKQHLTTPGHPQANGMVERFHRTLKQALRAVELERPGVWIDRLPEILLSFRCTPKEDGFSPADRMFRGTVRLGRDAFRVQPHAEVPPRVVKWNTTEGKIEGNPLKHETPWLLVRVEGHPRSLAPRYEGPYRVVTYKDKTVTVVKKGKEWNISKDRVKPFFGDGTPPRERARPARVWYRVPNPKDRSDRPVPDGIGAEPLERTEPVEADVAVGDTVEVELRECSVPLTPVQLPREEVEHQQAGLRTRSGREVRPPQRYSP